MSYVKQTFIDKKTVLSADHLNHIEAGIVANETAIAEKQPKGNYATEDFVTQKVAEAQLGSGSGYTHAIPTSLSMANAIKRARQLTDVEWTAKGKIPGTIRENGEVKRYEFVEGQTYKGVPYQGGTIKSYTYVGLNVDLDTFIGAVENPKSILYTYDDSSYYDTGAGYYGTVCSKFAQYALNIPSSFNTANMINVEGMETVALEGAYTVYDVKLCDVMVDIDHHTVLVTDILYDSFGRVAYVEIAEAVRPLCRRSLYTPEEFAENWVKDYRLIRYNHFDNIPYVKRDYVNIESENDEIVTHDYALMPQYGNKKNNKRKSGSTMPVHILKDGYTKAVVLRDGTVISEVDITNKTEFSYDLGTAGYIEMYLEDASGNKSESVYACVVSATVSVTDSSAYNQGTLKVSYTGTSGKPIFVQFGDGQSEFCRLDGKGRTTVANASSAELKFDVSRASKKIRVAYQNEYGTYFSEYVSFSITQPSEPTEPSIPAGENTSTDDYLSCGEYYDGYTLSEESANMVAADGSRVYSRIPIEANTTYTAEGAGRIWFFDRTRTEISSIVASEQETVGQFTTPDLAFYMSVAYGADTTPGSESIVRIGATNAVEDRVISETSATLWDNLKMVTETIKGAEDTGYFTYKHIPIESGATYYCRGGYRLWYLTDAATSAKITVDLTSETEKPYTFTVPDNITFMHVDFVKKNNLAHDLVRIRKLS